MAKRKERSYSDWTLSRGDKTACHQIDGLNPSASGWDRSILDMSTEMWSASSAWRSPSVYARTAVEMRDLHAFSDRGNFQPTVSPEGGLLTCESAVRGFISVHGTRQ